MERKSIIVFANQKGGTGKSTLCITYAHYLSTRAGKAVGAILDCDRQKTVVNQRKCDIEKYSGGETPCPFYFQVTGYSLENRETIKPLIETLREKPETVFLFDTPGTLDSQGLLVLLTEADAIVCPFHFDRKTVASTATFLQFVEKLREIMRKTQNKELAPVYLIPNMKDPSVGTAEERELWEEVREEFSHHATITPEIGRRVALERISTIELLDNQAEIVKDTFEFLTDKIFNRQ